MSLPSRSTVGIGLLVLALALLAVDLGGSQAVDPFSAPPPIALGSGQAPGGAHCSTPF